MPQVVVKKVVGVLFLEAAKVTLDHITTARLEQSARGQDGHELTRLYGEMRHLRDFLTRCVAGSSEQVTLELSPPECGLLVAALRRLHEVLDDRLVADPVMSADEKTLTQRKRHLLGDWAFELAAKPLVELPLPQINVVSTGAVRGLRTRLVNKIFEIQPGSGHPDAHLSDSGRMISASLLGASPDSRVPSSGGTQGIPGMWGDPERPSLSAAPGRAALFDPKTIRDPRLRALTQMDLNSLDRALNGNDHRVALVMLGSILESITIDYAESHRQSLALSGGPESWNLAKLTERCLGTAFAEPDRQILLTLHNAPNLLRPAQQMIAPIVVTPTTLQQALEFLRLCLRTLGFASDQNAGTRGPGVAPVY